MIVPLKASTVNMFDRVVSPMWEKILYSGLINKKVALQSLLH